jgi:predicted ArsR family transcriptional regulator
MAALDRTVHDPRVLRAIAHPTRNRILAELAATGPLRAADVAELVGVPANQASFHLRQLAKYGLIEPAPELARDGRDRVWRLTDDEGLALRPRDLAEEPGGKAALAVWRRSASAWGHRIVEVAYAEPTDDEDEYRSISEESVRLTRAEAAELTEELNAFVRGWVERGRGEDGERRTYLLFQILQPYPESDDRR